MRTTAEHCFYVSVDGDDGWSGGSPSPNAGGTDGPFATLRRARDAVRELKTAGGPAGPVKIMLAGRTHYLTEPLILESVDSGREGCPITYTAYPGEGPVISGGVRLSGWEPHEGEIMRCALPDTKGGKWKFRQLFFNGERQVRARWPGRDPDDPVYGGWAFVEAAIAGGDGSPAIFRYEATDPQRQWAKPHLAEVSVFPWYCWINDLIPLADVDPATRTIRLARPVVYPSMTLMPGNRFVVENVLEELRRPGEWCMDGEKRIVYFWPPAGLGESDEVVAPVTERLIELRGTPEDPVRFVNVSGLTFTETVSPFPDHGSCGAGWHSPTLCGGAVRLENAEDCRVENNVFHAVGGDAVRLHGRCSRNRVTGNQISYPGAAGVSLANKAPANAGTWTDKADLAKRSSDYVKVVGNVISNNHIHHCGVIKKNCGGVHVFGIASVDNVISHNLIHHTSDKGINIQDGFGRLFVEYNELHDVALEICDTGAIMVNRWFVLEDDDDLCHGSVFRHNLIRNVVGCGAYEEPMEGKGAIKNKAAGKIWSPYYTWGIYFDNSGMHATVFGNVIIGAVLGGVSTPVADPKDNLIENNIIIDCVAYQADLRVGGGAGTGNRFVRNIVCYRDPDAALMCVSPRTKQSYAECDHNVYFPASGREMRIQPLGFDEKDADPVQRFSQWQAMGFDAHSVVADPLFADPDNGDYSLRADSPALTLGFQPIDVGRIGLQRKPALGRSVAARKGK